MKILFTGANGFLGKNVIPLLREKLFEVKTFGTHNADYVYDITEKFPPFGENFDISVPFVIKGAPDEITLPRKDRSYVIPVEWCERKASIVVALRKKLN